MSTNNKASNKKAPGPDYSGRQRLLLGVLSLALSTLLWSAGGRQIVQKDYLQNQGEKRYLRELLIPAHRGEISDRNGEALAISSPMVAVWADPRHLPDDPAFIDKLSNIIGVPLDTLKTQLAQQNRGFIYLQRGLSPETGEEVRKLIQRYRLNSIGLEQEYHRYYPGGEVTAHVIGITDAKDKGQEGIEKAKDSELSGKPGLRRVVQDGQRRIVEEVQLVRSPEPGKALTLSIDKRIQFLAYLELKRAVRDHQAKAGTAVILDAQTSEIIAMVNQPSFNPNDRSTFVPAAMRNRAIIDLFEPGSTMKPLAVAASLEAGKSKPSTPVDTRPGQMRVGKYTVRDIHSYGLMTVTSVLTKSSNVGVTKLALALSPEYMWNIYDRLGVGHRTELKFPGEVSGTLPHFSGWSAFEQATHSFGYGLSMTALQLASAYAILAADGIRHPISMIKLDTPPTGERILKASTARAIRAMLETVISDQGTAKRATVEGYRVCGKTGTVKKATSGGYSNKHLGVFAGMIPAENPRLVMVIMIDEPSAKEYYGGLTAAPVFSAVMNPAMRMLNVPPDAPPSIDKELRQPHSRIAKTGGHP